MRTLPRDGVLSQTPASVRPRVHFASSADSSGAWRLPPLNHLMSFPSRFLATRLSSGDSSSLGSTSTRSGTEGVTFGSSLDNLLNESEDEWPPAHGLFQDVYSTGGSREDPRPQPEEIDLTVSDSDDDVQVQTQQSADGDNVVEIVEVLDDDSQPAPLRRKRRRPPPPNSNAAVAKRQRMTDMMRSADSTNISLLNNEVVEEFKKRLKCSICLDVLENMTSTLCGHIFCAGCVHQAIRANGKCPLCQRRLHPKDTHRLYF